MPKRKDDKTKDQCPECGFCPHCGQSAKPPRIVPRPYPVPWVYPYRPGDSIGPYYGEVSYGGRYANTSISMTAVNQSSERPC